jgi:hypothetical protein
MGEIYSREVLHHTEPKIGLLSNGATIRQAEIVFKGFEYRLILLVKETVEINPPNRNMDTTIRFYSKKGEVFINFTSNTFNPFLFAVKI